MARWARSSSYIIASCLPCQKSGKWQGAGQQQWAEPTRATARSVQVQSAWWHLFPFRVVFISLESPRVLLSTFFWRWAAVPFYSTNESIVLGDGGNASSLLYIDKYTYAYFHILFRTLAITFTLLLFGALIRNKNFGLFPNGLTSWRVAFVCWATRALTSWEMTKNRKSFTWMKYIVSLLLWLASWAVHILSISQSFLFYCASTMSRVFNFMSFKCACTRRVRVRIKTVKKLCSMNYSTITFLIAPCKSSFTTFKSNNQTSIIKSEANAIAKRVV